MARQGPQETWNEKGEACGHRDGHRSGDHAGFHLVVADE